MQNKISYVLHFRIIQFTLHYVVKVCINEVYFSWAAWGNRKVEVLATGIGAFQQLSSVGSL